VGLVDDDVLEVDLRDELGAKGKGRWKESERERRGEKEEVKEEEGKRRGLQRKSSKVEIQRWKSGNNPNRTHLPSVRPHPPNCSMASLTPGHSISSVMKFPALTPTSAACASSMSSMTASRSSSDSASLAPPVPAMVTEDRRVNELSRAEEGERPRASSRVGRAHV